MHVMHVTIQSLDNMEATEVTHTDTHTHTHNTHTRVVALVLSEGSVSVYLNPRVDLIRN